VTPRRRLLLLLALIAGLGWIAIPRLDVGTDITNMMPEGSEGTLAAISRGLTQTELSRTMILSVGADETAHAVAAARQLASALRELPEVGWLRTGVDENQTRAVYELYFPRRHDFLTDDPTALPGLLSDAGLAAAARTLRRELTLPTAPLVKKVAAADPLGAFRHVLDRFRGTQPDLRLHDGQFISPDGRWAILFLATRSSAFDGTAQRAFLDDLHARFNQVAAHEGGHLTLEMAGANRFAVEAERSIRADVRDMAILSTLGVAALVFAFYRSLRNFFLASLPVLAGILVAIAVGVFAFGRLDGITLGFGAALVGVVIDYPICLLTHVILAGRGTPVREVVGRVRGSIWLGGLTTMASFAGLGLTEFRGFRELALFAVVGVLTAVLVTLHVLPGSYVVPGSPPRLALRVSDALGRSVERAAARQGWLVLLAGLCLVLALPAATGLRWVDDLSKLWRMDPALQAEDERVRGRVSHHEASRLVIAVAHDRERALALNDTVYARLAPAVASGALGGVRSLHAFLWSQGLLRTNREAVGAAAAQGLSVRVDRIFAEAGFRPGAFEPFARDLAARPLDFLSYDALVASPLGDLVRSSLVPIGRNTAAITYLRDVKDEAVVRAAVADLGGVHFFDQQTFLNEIYAAFRTTTVEQIFVGNGLVVALLIARYRRPRPAIAAFLPSVLAVSVLLGLFALLRAEMNLLHAISLVMVTGMGVDYAVLVVDAARRGSGLGPALLSNLLCALTTVFTFGVMAVSQHPALQAIGVTVGLGVLLSFLLAPVALLVLERE
jgi:predicted exporter